MKNRLWLLFWLIIFITSCSRQPSATRQLVIAMNKTACYGSCPIYTVEIYDDQSVLYRGERYVPLEGEHVFKIDKRDFDNLVKAFLDAGFFNFETSYTQPITDLPTTFIGFTYEGESKKIRDYAGAPPELRELEMKVEDFVKKSIWKEKAN